MGNSAARKSDIVNIAILAVLASCIGAYLVATAVLIAEDGVRYVEEARSFSVDPARGVKGEAFGYPFLIFAAHKIAVLFGAGSSIQVWIYSAQGMALLCRVLALIPLYLIGRILVGGRQSFWAVLILVMLPYPAHFGSDALRDWPYILFLAAGLLFLFRGAERAKWWMFGAAGLMSGLGHIIRVECAQLVVYGSLWLLIRLLWPKGGLGRVKLICALVVLLLGFAVPAVPYMRATGQVLPEKMRKFIDFSYQSSPNEILKQNAVCQDTAYFETAGVPTDILKAFGELGGGIANNLMFFFLPLLVIGVWDRFPRFCLPTGRRGGDVTAEVERFFVPAFVCLNIIMLVLLYCRYGYISRRHSLPLVVLLIFYVPAGVQIFSDWLGGKFSEGHPGANRKLWFLVVVITGLAVCTPKLLRPIRIEKRAYRLASEWLKENTKESELVAVTDERISFYAERKGVLYGSGEATAATLYVVEVEKDKEGEVNLIKNAREQHSWWVDKQKNRKRIVIYKLMK